MFGVQRLLSVRYHCADLRRGEESIIFFWSAGNASSASHGSIEKGRNKEAHAKAITQGKAAFLKV
jgi:hypothetical protein